MDMTHQDWLEGQASDQLEREAYDRSRFDDRTVLQGDGWEVIHDTVDNFWFLNIGLGSHLFAEDEIVLFANAILSEVEGAQRDSEADARTVGVDQDSDTG